MDRLGNVTERVVVELVGALEKFPKFNSAHEGYAVLLEEVDELWEEVRKNPSRRSNTNMMAEAIQVAAMAMRFVYDLSEDGTLRIVDSDQNPMDTLLEPVLHVRQLEPAIGRPLEVRPKQHSEHCTHECAQSYRGL